MPAMNQSACNTKKDKNERKKERMYERETLRNLSE